MRNYELYLDDIKLAVSKIQQYTKKLSFLEFCNDEKTIDAVIRNFEIIGEAAKHIPNKNRIIYPDVDWEAMIGMRNILTHEYFGVNMEIIWKTIKSKLPELKKSLDK